MRRTLCTLAATLAWATHVPAADVASYRDTYQKKLAEIMQASSIEINQTARQYQEAVDSLLVRVRKSGNLDHTQAIATELERFATNRAMPETRSTVPELRAMQSVYNEQCAALDLRTARRVVDLTSQYDLALERLEKTLVAENKVQDAQAVRFERTAAAQAPICRSAQATVTRNAPTNRPATAVQQKATSGEPQKTDDAAVVSKGLVLHYTFDDISAMGVADHSPSGRPGSLVGEATVVPGRIRDALSFDGTASYVEVTPFTAIPKGSDFSVCLWLRQPVLTPYMAIVSAESFVVMAHKNSMGWCWPSPEAKGGHILFTPVALSTNQWQHISFVRRGAALEYYVDGRLIAEQQPTPPLPPTTVESLWVARSMTPKTGSPMVGDIDELMIFSRALSRAEIQKIKKAADSGSDKRAP